MLTGEVKKELIAVLQKLVADHQHARNQVTEQVSVISFDLCVYTRTQSQANKQTHKLTRTQTLNDDHQHACNQVTEQVCVLCDMCVYSFNTHTHTRTLTLIHTRWKKSPCVCLRWLRQLIAHGHVLLFD